jgi:hypothetical protein
MADTNSTTQQFTRGPAWAAEAARNGVLSTETHLAPPEFAAALSALGFKITTKTLATKRCRGGGAPFKRWEKYVTYHWGQGLAWAQSRLSAPMSSTSQIAAPRTASAPLSVADTSQV